MAERPVYIPSPESPQLVEERFFTIKWNPGFALSQKGEKHRSFARSRQGWGARSAPGDFQQVQFENWTPHERVSHDGGYPRAGRYQIRSLPFRGVKFLRTWGTVHRPVPKR